MKTSLLLVLFTLVCSFNAHAQSNDRVAFGGKLICQLDDLGGVDCETYAGYRRLQPPSDTPALTTISAGDVHVCGITQAGAAFCWGDNNFGQLNAPQDVQFIGMSSGQNLTCGITTDNSAVCWGLDTHGETQPPADKRYTQTAHHETTSCGVELDGRVSCWGQFPDQADFLAEFRFSKIDMISNVVCGVADQDGVRCNFASDIPGDMIDVAVGNSLVCGVTATGSIDCRTNVIAFQSDLAARVSEINQGPNVIAVYHDTAASNNIFSTRRIRVCYELDTGELGCIARDNDFMPILQASGPEVAQNLNAFIYSDSTIELVWDVLFTVIAGADIYRNGELLATTQNGISYIDDTLVPGVQYEYSVALFDTVGVRSELSTPFSVTTGQSTGGINTGGYTPVNRPFDPTGLIVINYNQNEIELFWDRVSSITNNFSGYEIWRDHEFVAFTRGVSFYDNSVQPNTSYDYDVVAVSEDGSILGFNGIEVNTTR